MKRFDVAIVGAGIMGAMTACELARSGVSVALIDQAKLPNPGSASVDHSKVFRFAYPDPLYARLAVSALELWRGLEGESGTELLTETGVLMIGRAESASERETYRALRSLGLDVEMMTSGETASRFPQFNADAFHQAVYDPRGGILHAEAAVRAAIDLARRRAVTVFEAERVQSIDAGSGRDVEIATQSGQKIESAKAIVAAGPWTRTLVPFLDSILTTTRQEVVYFEPGARVADFAIGSFPIFLELESGFYGFPVHHGRALKLANHHKGASVDPYACDNVVGDDFLSSCRAFFSEFIPSLRSASVRETRVCLYNNTPDDDFIVDWHPETDAVLIVTGFSGHGFKFGSVIGRIAAEMLISGKASYDIERFSLSRFN